MPIHTQLSSFNGFPSAPAVRAVPGTALPRAGFVPSGGLRRFVSLPGLRELSSRRRDCKAAMRPQELLGETYARELDVAYASLQPVRIRPSRPKDNPMNPWELHQDGSVIVHPSRMAVVGTRGSFPNLLGDPRLAALLNEGKKYIWAVAAMGTLFIGEEICLEGLNHKGNPRHLGHVSLVFGRPARLCGEIFFDRQAAEFIVNSSSGHYSRYADRGRSHLENVAQLLKRLGLSPLRVQHKNVPADFKSYSLVMESLAPASAQTNMNLVSTEDDAHHPLQRP
jgi:hypothetical protein